MFAHRKLSPKFARKTGRRQIKKAAEAVLKSNGSRSEKNPAAGTAKTCLTLASLLSPSLSAKTG
jgi:hypothetical protein